MVGMGQKDAYGGDEAQSKRGILTLSIHWKVESAQIGYDFEKYGIICSIMSLELHLKNYPILLSEEPNNPNSNREKMVQIMFETFNVPALYVLSSPQMVLFSYGSETGVVVERNDSHSTVTVIYQGHPLHMLKLEVGERSITEYLMKIMSERGYSFTTTAEREIVRDIKEKLGYFAQEYNTEMGNSNNEKNYELPDGQVHYY
eukprot:TRINITY_DN968_c0_g1_i1.p1 TRINITY_DN968_c0_g1~~TRINITY_DN968_c0_g1_i1.p1  ORF type:complete len:202 (-),score=18.24 TRINITY_DN968_c0_g1_i1:581-1186(-)